MKYLYELLPSNRKKNKKGSKARDSFIKIKVFDSKKGKDSKLEFYIDKSEKYSIQDLPKELSKFIRENPGFAKEQNRDGMNKIKVEVRGLTMGQQYEVATQLKSYVREIGQDIMRQSIVIDDGPYKSSAKLIENYIKG